MKALEGELALAYCRQARQSLSRVVELATEPKSVEQLERALFNVTQLERCVKVAVARSAVRK